MNLSRLLIALTCAALAILPGNLHGQLAGGSVDTARQTRPHPHELYGFLLRQDRKAFRTALGESFHQEMREGGRIVNAYHIPGAKDTYLVVFYDNDHATQLEVTGTDYFGPTGFLGLRLGDNSAKIESTLGKPTEIRHEIEENLDLWDYKDANYSLEFTPDHKLYSIQIIDESFEPKIPTIGSAGVHSFAEAIRTHNIDKLMQMASGELECFRSEYFGLHSGAARSALADEKSGVSVCLKQAADAILALGPEMKGAENEIRVWTKANPGTVTKFPATSPLKEVVFVQEARSWRVYEVTFR